MQIQIDPRQPQAEDGPVVTMRFDEDAMNEIRGYLAERGNDEIRAIFDEAEVVADAITIHRTGTETITTPEGNEDTVETMIPEFVDAYVVTLPQAARQPFVAVLSGIGAGGAAVELATLLEA